jgi:hypothetical protein
MKKGAIFKGFVGMVKRCTGIADPVQRFLAVGREKRLFF